VIARDGSVTDVQNYARDTTTTDQNVIACINRGFAKLKFPAPEGGVVTVRYPIVFSD
jgi:hypothetical protein